MASSNVTVMVEKAVPSAARPVLGLADTEELNALTAAATKVTWAVWVMLVVPTRALIVLVFACVEVNTAVVRPFVPVAAGVVSEYAPPPATDKITVWPGIGLSFASFMATVMVEDALPFAVTLLVGFAVTVERAALTAPGTKVTTKDDAPTAVPTAVPPNVAPKVAVPVVVGEVNVAV